MPIAGKTVLVTGGSGFLGQHLVRVLRERGANVAAPSRAACDLTQWESVTQCFSALKPEIVVHAAGLLGGIQFNRLYPAEVFRANLLMVCHLLEAAHQHQVSKLVNIGSACVYSDQLQGPYHEKDLLSGPMHPSVQYYGLSKRALYIGGQAYQEQHGLRSIHLVLANLFGPGDKFDPQLSHVISSMLPRFYEAAKQHEPEVGCWGTGKTVREFLYVEDCVEAILRATERYEGSEPLNLGTGRGMTMRELAEDIGEAVGFQGRITWDTSRPDGAPYKVMDVSRMQQVLEFIPPTSMQEGLHRTAEWFAANYETWVTR